MHHVTVIHRQAGHFKIPLLSEASPCTLMLPDNEKGCCRHLSSIIFKCQDVGGNSVKEPAVVGYHHHRSCMPLMPLAFKPHSEYQRHSEVGASSQQKRNVCTTLPAKLLMAFSSALSVSTSRSFSGSSCRSRATLCRLC